MKKFSKISSKIIVFLVVGLAVSCTTIIDWDKQLDTLITGQSYVIPIGETTLTLNDIIKQLDSTHSVVEPGENYIYLQFQDTINWDFRDIADFQNFVTINETYALPVGTIQNQTVTSDFNYNVALNFNSAVEGQRIDRIDVNSAKVEITVIPENLDVDTANIIVTTLFQPNELVFGVGSNHGIGSRIEFTPSKFNTPEVITLNPFTIFSPNNLSTLNIKLRVEVKAGNTSIATQTNSKVSIAYRIFDVDTKAFYGVIKPVIANEEQGKIVDMAKYVMQLPAKGVFKIAEPLIKFDILNNSGIKINLALDSIKAYKSDDPNFVPVFAKFDGQKSTTKLVDRIATFGGAPVKSTFYLDHTLANGEISHFFDRFPLPDRLFYQFKLANARSASDPLDFASPSSNLTAYVDIKIPLKLNSGSSFELVDTLKNIDMSELINLQVIDQMLLVLKVTNNLPLKGKISVEFLDENKLPISGLKILADSVKAPQIDDNGYVVSGSAAVSDINIVVENAQLPKLILAKNLVYSLKVESEKNKKIVLQKENFIKLKLGKYSRGE